MSGQPKKSSPTFEDLALSRQPPPSARPLEPSTGAQQPQGNPLAVLDEDKKPHITELTDLKIDMENAGAVPPSMVPMDRKDDVKRMASNVPPSTRPLEPSTGAQPPAQPAAQPPPGVPRSRVTDFQEAARRATDKRRQILNARSGLAIVCTITVVVSFGMFTIVPYAPSGGSPFTSELNLAQLCRTRSTANPLVSYMFSLLDKSRNDTTQFIYVNPAANVQVTNIARWGGMVVATELIDFNTQQVVLFPHGRTEFPVDRMPTVPCQISPVDEEKNWAEIACTTADRISLDAMQMTTGAPLVPVEMPPAFFFTPLVCIPPAPDNDRDVSLPIVEPPMDFFKTFISDPFQLVFLPTALNQLLDLLSHEFDSTYINNPQLAERLSASLALFGPTFFNASRTFFSARSASASNATAATCCGTDMDCQMRVNAAPGFAQTCTAYTSCSTSLDYAPSCMPTDERPCECDFQLRTSLAAPGHTQCGDCIDDIDACDCYAFAWLIRYLASIRPCQCQGTCLLEPFLYVCRTEKVTHGFFETTSELILHWCPRILEFSCNRCHSPPTQVAAPFCRLVDA
jgi:hypothetical protein